VTVGGCVLQAVGACCVWHRTSSSSSNSFIPRQQDMPLMQVCLWNYCNPSHRLSSHERTLGHYTCTARWFTVTSRNMRIAPSCSVPLPFSRPQAHEPNPTLASTTSRRHPPPYPISRPPPSPAPPSSPPPLPPPPHLHLSLMSLSRSTSRLTSLKAARTSSSPPVNGTLLPLLPLLLLPAAAAAALLLR